MAGEYIELLGKGISSIWSFICQQCVQEPPMQDFADYEQGKVGATLLFLVLTISSFTCFMFVRVKVPGEDSFISVLLNTMAINFLVLVVVIFNYVVYYASASEETRILFYVCITVSCLTMFSGIVYYARLPGKPLVTLKERVQERWRIMIDSFKKAFSSTKSPRPVSFPECIYHWFASLFNIEGAQKTKGRARDGKERNKK